MMRSTLLTIFIISLSFVQAQAPNLALSFRVTDAGTNELLLDGAHATIYQDGEYFDSDTADFWGQFRAFYLPLNHNYTFVIGKDGYVSKRGTIDAHHDQPDSIKVKRWAIDFPCMVSMFEECSAGDYAFMETEPLIKFSLDSAGHQTWDREHARKMAEKVNASHYVNVSADTRDKFVVYYMKAMELMEIKYFEDALAELNKAKEFIDCGRVNHKMAECQKEIDAEKVFKEHIKNGDRLLEEKKYDKALDEYEMAALIRPEDTYVNEQISKVYNIKSAKKE